MKHKYIDTMPDGVIGADPRILYHCYNFQNSHTYW
jgi:hypothetical protein